MALLERRTTGEVRFIETNHNGWRVLITATQLTDAITQQAYGGADWLVTVHHGTKVGAHGFQGVGYLSWDYVAEKFDLHVDADRALAELLAGCIAHLLGREAPATAAKAADVDHSDIGRVMAEHRGEDAGQYP